MRLELDLPFRIESLNRGQRLGLKATIAKIRGQRFAQRGKVKRQRNGTHMILKTKLAGQLRARLLREGERLVITLTRRGPGMLDDDNLAAGFKPVRDGIADALGVNDSNPMLRWFYAQEHTGRGVYSARVLFETMTRRELGARLAAAEEASA
ncbi:MAG: hypothetical protein AAB721_02980 [Patescibacteria group bacterium]